MSSPYLGADSKECDDSNNIFLEMSDIFHRNYVNAQS